MYTSELDAPPTSTELPSGMNKRYTCSISKLTFLCISYGSLYLMFKIYVSSDKCEFRKGGHCELIDTENYLILPIIL